MKNEEQPLREKFEEFLVKNNIVFQKSGEYSSILDFFTTHHRQALKRVEGLKFVQESTNSDYWVKEGHTTTEFTAKWHNKILDDALAIIREEI